jgi:hypothetical protein
VQKLPVGNREKRRSFTKEKNGDSVFEKKWYIIHSGKDVRGPFTLEEVTVSLPNLAKGSLLVADGVEPIFAHDETGFQEITNHGCLLASIENVASVLPTPFSRTRPEPKNEFISVATNDVALGENYKPESLNNKKNRSLVIWIKRFLKSGKHRDTQKQSS